MLRPMASNSSVLQPAPRPAVTRSPPASTASWANCRNNNAGCCQAVFATTVCTPSRSDSAATAARVVIGSQAGCTLSDRGTPSEVPNK